MKAIQITMDEDLLKRLDDVDQVRQEGRSAVLRHLVAEYVWHKEQEAIDQGYRRAYASVDEPLGPDWEDWEGQGHWPDE